MRVCNCTLCLQYEEHIKSLEIAILERVVSKDCNCRGDYHDAECSLDVDISAAVSSKS